MCSCVDMHFGVTFAWGEADWATDARDHESRPRWSVPHPGSTNGLRPALEECDRVQSERLSDLLKERRHRLRAPQHTARQGEQCGRLSSCARRLPGPASRDVDDHTD